MVVKHFGSHFHDQMRIKNGCFFIGLEHYFKEAQDLDNDVISRLVYESIVIKSSIVNRDEKEKGERRKLNFGHTFGHAIEKTTDKLLHGEAISVGMVVASKLSERKGLLSNQEMRKIEAILTKLELPIALSLDREIMMDAIKKDKKRSRYCCCTC